jgi:hypothetical protein
VLFPSSPEEYDSRSVSVAEEQIVREGQEVVLLLAPLEALKSATDLSRRPVHSPLRPPHPPRLVKRQRRRQADEGAQPAIAAPHRVLQQRQTLHVAPSKTGQPDAQ